MNQIKNQRTKSVGTFDTIRPITASPIKSSSLLQKTANGKLEESKRPVEEFRGSFTATSKTLN